MDNNKKEARAQLEALRELKRRKNLKDYSDNFEKFSSDQIRIITKDATKGFVPFEFNEAQTIINEALEKQRKETGKVRAIILKARHAKNIAKGKMSAAYWANKVKW
jgi:glycerol-3-phosphate dehydrogenase